MGKKNNKIVKQAQITGELTASNALDEALRMSPCDLWNSQQPSLSSMNGYNNMKIDVLSLQQILLTYLYKTFGILGKIVDVPVDDAYRYGGFDIEAETIDDNELKDLEQALIRNNDIKMLKQARKWARLFGGGALIVLDGGKLDQPLNYNRLYERPIQFVAVDRWQLNYSKPNVTMPGGEWFLTNYDKVEDIQAQVIHPSRIKLLYGKQAPFIIQQQVQGWGISVYEQIFQDISQLFKARNVLFELLDEAKTDILKLESLKTALSSDTGTRAVQRMVDFIAKNKNYKSQITMSTADEYEQKQMTFAGFEGILKEIRVMISGSANMPVNKLWGEGVTGFGSGEDSLENYNAQIESEIRSLDMDAIYWILKIRCYQLFGREIEDLTIDWKELRVLSSTDEQTLHDRKLDNVLKLFDRQLLTPQEVMEILKKQKIIIHNTKALRGELEDMPLYNNENMDIKPTDEK